MSPTTSAQPAKRSHPCWDRFRSNGDDAGEAWCLVELGVLHRYTGRLGISRTLLQAALIAAEAAGDGPAIRRSSREVAVTLRFDGRSDQAVEVLEELVGMEPAGGHGLANTLKELAASVELRRAGSTMHNVTTERPARMTKRWVILGQPC